jgi:hypothetical protein
VGGSVSTCERASVRAKRACERSERKKE